MTRDTSADSKAIGATALLMLACILAWMLAIGISGCGSSTPPPVVIPPPPTLTYAGVAFQWPAPAGIQPSDVYILRDGTTIAAVIPGDQVTYTLKPAPASWPHSYSMTVRRGEIESAVPDLVVVAVK